MKNQTPTTCPPSQQLAIIPYKQSISNQPPKSDNTTRINSTFRVKLFSDLMEEFHKHYTTEKLITVTFLRVMTTTSFSHLVIGFELLEETGLSRSMSPIVMSLFKYTLAILAGFSMACVDVYCGLLKAPMRGNRRSLVMCTVLPLAYFLSRIVEKYGIIFYYICDVSYIASMGGFSTGHGKYGWYVNFGVYFFLQTVASPIAIRFNMSSDMVPVLSIITSCFRSAVSFDLTSSAPSPLCLLDKSIKQMLPVAATRIKSMVREKRKLGKCIKYAIALVRTLLFQNFFRLTTFGHVKAFMHLAISWVANLALMNASHDFGILNFLLGNMILGSTVSQSGLGITTWITYAICLFLYIFGTKIKTMKTSQNIQNFPKPPFLFWIFYCCAVFDFLYNIVHQT